jgi:hypothetical protein
MSFTHDEDEFYQKKLVDQEIQSALQSAFDWLSKLTYWYGWAKGIEAKTQALKNNSSSYLLTEWSPEYKDSYFHWYISHGCANAQILVKDWDNLSKSLFLQGEGVHRVLDSYLWGVLSSENVVYLSQAIDQMIIRFFPGIQQRDSLRFCSSPIHRLGQRPEICTPIGDKWLCDDCLNCYSLNAPLPAPLKETKRERSEREKMTASLRFSILERDRFTCKACGRSPSLGDNVKLHVDHIIPIEEGGKTEESNLQTLCQDCNLGKGTHIVGQG